MWKKIMCLQLILFKNAIEKNPGPLTLSETKEMVVLNLLVIIEKK